MNDPGRQAGGGDASDTRVFRIDAPMIEHTHRRTKIVATVGPASRAPKMPEGRRVVRPMLCLAASSQASASLICLVAR